jgi:hypothetical protein
MIDLRPHRKWIGLLALAALMAVTNASVLDLALDKAEGKRQKLNAENKEAAADLRQLKEDLLAVEKMKDEIDADTAKKDLAPVDRLRAARTLENRATEAKLTRLTYTFSPEEKVTVDTVAAGKQDFALSKWTVSADAPTDLDAYVFLDSLSRTLPGQVTFRQLSIQRLPRKSDNSLSTMNVHLRASGEWLSNGAIKNIAELAR